MPSRAPFLSLRPRSTTAVYLTCEHASRRLPAPANPTPGERAILASHWGIDIGAWALTRELSRRGGYGAIGGRWSRLLIDLNRRVDDPTLVRPDAEGMTLSWNHGVDAAEIERRALAYHAPYHAEIDRQLVRRIVRGVRPVVLAIHTFTAVLHHRRRNFDVGVLYDEHTALARRMARTIRRSGLTVRYNQPYSGMAGMMYAVDRHGSHLDLPCLELEVNHDRLSDPEQVDAVADAVAPAVEELAS